MKKINAFISGLKKGGKHKDNKGGTTGSNGTQSPPSTSPPASPHTPPATARTEDRPPTQPNYLDPHPPPATTTTPVENNKPTEQPTNSTTSPRLGGAREVAKQPEPQHQHHHEHHHPPSVDDAQRDASHNNKTPKQDPNYVESNENYSRGTHDIQVALSSESISIDQTDSSTKISKYTPLPFKEEHVVDHGSTTPKQRASGPPEILPEEIEYDETHDFLGQGSFGAVYKGRCRGQEVAVKVPRKQKLSQNELISFRNEVKIMSKIYHPNVVLFLGACTQMGKMQIVTEKCMTDLEKMLANDKKKNELSLYQRLRMAKDAALGMNWLHGITRIVHNDLKTANLLVDSNLRVKVTDFGFSQIKEGSQFVDKAKKGTPLWMAPEIMMGNPYDDKADVYSFGIIMWEIYTKDVPYAHHNDYATFYKAVCIDHERPVLPDDTLPAVGHLIRSCWDHDARNRPSFNEIVFRLNEALVDCVIENEPGRQLWKERFLLPKQELMEHVPWAEFVEVLTSKIGQISIPLDSLKLLLATTSKDPTLGAKDREEVTLERLDKVIKWFGPFFEPQSGLAVISEISTLMYRPWFHGDITREDAMARLAKQPEGTFLIRLSSTDPKVSPFTLSMKDNQHRRIKRAEKDGAVTYKIQGRSTIYNSLVELVEKCEDYNLRRPCPKREADGYSPYDAYMDQDNS